jgi:hypothetical protein
MARGLAIANRDEIMESFFGDPNGTENLSDAKPNPSVPCLTDRPKAEVSVPPITQRPTPVICSEPGCGYQLNANGSCTGCIMERY